VAIALGQALSRSGYSVTAVASRSYGSAAKLAAAIDGCAACHSAQEVADRCNLIFITTPDDAIPLVAGSIKWKKGQAVIHCSGADSTEALISAAEQGAVTGAFHPLQSLAGGPNDADKLKGITFAVEANEPLLSQLKDMAEALGGQWLILKAEDRALYHAAAVVACNYMVTLTGMAADMWGNFGADGGQAVRALLPLIKGTLSNIESDGLPGCLTGPIARGDTGTIRKHLAAISQKSPNIEEAYRVMGLATLPIAQAKGQLSAEAAGEISGLLKGTCHAA
jgi:predicted short-subunit dehydrogenase-like oxidoreductase (DUF2520 family)